MGNFDLFRVRRERVMRSMAERGADGVAIFVAAPSMLRNGDVEQEYRQDSDFYYLTGFTEPQSVLVLSAKERTTTMFVRPRDPEREIWDGARAGVDGAKEVYGADAVFTIGELDSKLPPLIHNQQTLFYRLGQNRAFDDRVLGIIDRARSRSRAGIGWPSEIVDLGTIVHEMRLIKDATDLAAMRKAAQITAQAHVRAMQRAAPGLYEYEIEAVLLETFRRCGSERAAYGSIVGSGENATVLHYRSNNRKMQDGDLLLIDAGCEYDYYASDVTRTFPVNGKFSRAQQAIYELVLEAQLASIAATRVGTTLEAIHHASVRTITVGLVRLGLLSGDIEKLVEEGTYKQFFMHRTSHWLGMDVHDVGAYYVQGAARKLESGMVLTVEPGIYIAKDCDKVGPEWRGIGVRIEDDILVSEESPVNLTAEIPQTVAHIEEVCRG